MVQSTGKRTLARCEFILSQDENTLEKFEAGHIRTKDHFMCIKKVLGVPTVRLVQAEARHEEEQEEEKSSPLHNQGQLRKRAEKCNPKGKSVASSLKKQ